MPGGRGHANEREDKMKIDKLIIRTIKLLHGFIKEEQFRSIEYCATVNTYPPYYICSRGKSHKGPHIAIGHNSKDIYVIWKAK